MNYFVPGLSLACLIVMVVGLLRQAKAKGDQRARHLCDYPTVESVLATLDQDKYRQIRDTNGRGGVVHAARALRRDFPGITLKEAADVITLLGL